MHAPVSLWLEIKREKEKSMKCIFLLVGALRSQRYYFFYFFKMIKGKLSDE